MGIAKVGYRISLFLRNKLGLPLAELWQDCGGAIAWRIMDHPTSGLLETQWSQFSMSAQQLHSSSSLTKAGLRSDGDILGLPPE